MASKNAIDLNGTWELSWQDGERGPARRPGVLERAAARPRQAFTATVPGEVHLDLMAAGVIGDPVLGTNCPPPRWGGGAFWKQEGEHP